MLCPPHRVRIAEQEYVDNNLVSLASQTRQIYPSKLFGPGQLRLYVWRERVPQGSSIIVFPIVVCTEPAGERDPTQTVLTIYYHLSCGE